MNMEMHQAGRRADWVSIAGDRRTIWQHIAARTNGIITPGNVVSIAGLVFVLSGIYMVIQGQYVSGFFWVGLGRSADIADGIVAHRTGTKSPLGEAVDAAIDKVELLAALVGLFIAGLLPLSYVIAIALLNGTIAIVSVVAKAKGHIVHPVRSGKLATLLLWMAIAALIGSMIIDSIVLALTGRVTIVAACILAVVALAKYVICVAEIEQKSTRTEE